MMAVMAVVAAWWVGRWEWSAPPSSALPIVPALLYRSSRWEKMFENLLKLTLRPGSEPGWGCAAGGAPERDLRLGAARPLAGVLTRCAF